ncbi:MAG: MoxR family ATPase [Pseudomonadota bacterium]
MNETLSQNDVDALVENLAGVREAIGRTVVGQHDVIEQLLVVLLASGHGLIEGVPGLAKTLLVRTLAQALDLDFQRIQFTPDLMPGDVLGSDVLKIDADGQRRLEFQRGPVFTNLLLADEINRTPARTQAALLECMQERTVTYAGRSQALAAPFVVLATQNPVEQTGTYALPEAQLDRFLLHIAIDYPSEKEERDVLLRTTGARGPKVESVMTGDDVIRVQALVRDVVISDALLDGVNALIRSTRPGDTANDDINACVQWGAGPRASQALVLCAKARALLHGRYAVTRADLAALALPALRHRLVLTFEADAREQNVRDLVLPLIEQHLRAEPT